ncbi:hypothetical protein T484DRAFT_1756569 [Baffinella frigidus]|nr:hypothetical protein T484DRAFT_1756569 [Cryptophyta sp. CCMP2293]
MDDLPSWIQHSLVTPRIKRDSSSELCIMTAALALPSKWDDYKQLVCTALVADEKHFEACMKACIAKQQIIQHGDPNGRGGSTYESALSHEKSLFAMITIRMNGIPRSDPVAGRSTMQHVKHGGVICVKTEPGVSISRPVEVRGMPVFKGMSKPVEVQGMPVKREPVEVQGMPVKREPVEVQVMPVLQGMLVPVEAQGMPMPFAVQGMPMPFEVKREPVEPNSPNCDTIQCDMAPPMGPYRKKRMSEQEGSNGGKANPMAPVVLFSGGGGADAHARVKIEKVANACVLAKEQRVQWNIDALQRIENAESNANQTGAAAFARVRVKNEAAEAANEAARLAQEESDRLYCLSLSSNGRAKKPRTLYNAVTFNSVQSRTSAESQEEVNNELKGDDCGQVGWKGPLM